MGVKDELKKPEEMVKRCLMLTKTSQELRMLSSVTLNCHVTKIVMDSVSQLSELSQMSQLTRIVFVVMVRSCSCSWSWSGSQGLRVSGSQGLRVSGSEGLRV